MKSAITLFVLFVLCLSTAYSSCSYWKKRMEKYGALVNCDYYVTSENEYKDFFALDEVAKRNENNTLQIRFFTLSPETIQFVLSEKNDSSDTSSVSDSDSRPYGDYFSTTSTTPPPNNYRQSAGWSSGGRSYYNTADYDEEPTVDNHISVAYTTKATPIRASSDSGEPFKFVFGNKVFNDVRNIDTESFITKGSKRLKSLLTPGIVRKNEPNEVLIELFADGKIRTTINENDTLELRGYNVALKFKYISFSSPKNQVLTEFFYNCKN